MKILITPFNYYPNIAGGGEVYLYRLCQWLIKQGHEVKCIAYVPEKYVHDGIEVYPQKDTFLLWIENNELFEWADIVISQLLGSSYGYNKAYIQHKKPLIFIAHNTSRGYPHEYSTNNIHVIYNAQATKEALNYPHNSIVLSPPVDFKEFTPVPINQRKYVTLINCNEDKGGNKLIELAKALPKVKFMGVIGGYGEQIKADLPNLTYHDYVEKIEDVLKETKILIMPSKRESFGQVATEAASMGIPVICTDLPGLRENLGDAGIYTDDFKTEIAELLKNKEIYKQKSDEVLARAKELQPDEELKKVEKWMLQIVS
jgi:glycosyltransferase involved in cell wall biosynthesis